MTRHQTHNTQSEDPINLLLEHGLAEGLPQIAEMLMNTAMLIERSSHSERIYMNAAKAATDMPMD
jgi:hypothetical protein